MSRPMIRSGPRSDRAQLHPSAKRIDHTRARVQRCAMHGSLPRNSVAREKKGLGCPRSRYQPDTWWVRSAARFARTKVERTVRPECGIKQQATRQGFALNLAKATAPPRRAGAGHDQPPTGGGWRAGAHEGGSAKVIGASLVFGRCRVRAANAPPGALRHEMRPARPQFFSATAAG